MKSARAKACDIPQKVKQKVWERDQGRCVICGNNYNVMPNAHYIPRTRGGLGIEENVFTACTNLTDKDKCQCHRKFDNDQVFRKKVTPKIQGYFKSLYPGWDERNLIYQKYR